MAALAILGEGLLETGHALAEDEGGVVDDVGDGRIDLRAERRDLGLEVEEGHGARFGHLEASGC